MIKLYHDMTILKRVSVAAFGRPRCDYLALDVPKLNDIGVATTIRAEKQKRANALEECDGRLSEAISLPAWAGIERLLWYSFGGRGRRFCRRRLKLKDLVTTLALA